MRNWYISAAVGTIESRAVGLNDPRHPSGAGYVAGAAGAGLACAVIDREPVLEIAQLARCLDIIAQGGAAGGDGLGQHLANHGHQPLGATSGHGRSDPLRADPGPEQRLAHICCPGPPHGLVQQGRFDRRDLGFQRAGQRFGVELVAQRLRPQRCQQRWLSSASAPVIAIRPNRRASLNRISDRRRWSAGHGHALRAAPDPGRWSSARHAEMDDQHLIVVQMDQDVLGAPPDGDDPAAGQPL